MRESLITFRATKSVIPNIVKKNQSENLGNKAKKKKSNTRSNPMRNQSEHCI
jgi:hypothetical protein